MTQVASLKVTLECPEDTPQGIHVRWRLCISHTMPAVYAMRVFSPLHTTQEALAGLRPESVSPRLQELIMWCFEFSRHSRPSFQQIQEALTDLLDKGPHNPLARS